MGAKYIPFGTSNSLKSSKYKTPLIKFLNIGRAAFDPVSYLPKVLDYQSQHILLQLNLNYTQ